jgi:hypothetical protein
MNIKKIIVNKSFVLATTAAIALVADAGNAVAAPVDLVGGVKVTLIGMNLTKGCVRFYADSQHDVAAGSEWKLGTVGSGQGFTRPFSRALAVARLPGQSGSRCPPRV